MIKNLNVNYEINYIQQKQLRFSNKEKKDPCKELVIKLVKEIAKKSLIELAVSLAFTAAACFFVATPVGMATLLICSVAAVGINILWRSGSAYCQYRLFKLKQNPSIKAQEKKDKFQFLLGFFQHLAPITFSSLVDINTRELIVHEGGHALTTKILVKNPGVHIRINPFQGAVTSYRLGALTSIGEFFGRANSKLLIAAAGPALSIVAASVNLAASLALRKSNPELSRYLNIIAIDSVVQHVFYALSALWTSSAQRGHDFIQLMAGGIHPIAAVVSIIALPLIVRIGFFIHDTIKEKAAEREAKHVNKKFLLARENIGLNN